MKKWTGRLATCAVALLCCAFSIALHANDRPAFDLDGHWEFRFAADDRGTTEQWQKPGVPFEQEITVPGCWDAQGIGDATDKMRHNAVGVGWYRQKFEIPADRKGHHVWLNIGGVHRSAVVYVNGQQVAEHFGYPLACQVDITDKLIGGEEQTLVLAVDSRRHTERDPLYGTFDLPDFMYIDWGGIFEHVKVEATGESWIDSVAVRPDPIQHQAGIELEIGGTSVAADGISYSVYQGDKVLAQGHVSPETKSWLIALPTAPLWTPADPQLLKLHLELHRGNEVLDERFIRFGLRKLEIHDGQFFLNGDRIFLRGYGDDFNFPRELLPPAEVKFWKAYLQKRKDFGFNFVRHHSMMPSESYLQAADEVGMLVQPELPIVYMERLNSATPTARQLYPAVWEGYIRQMRNHPCIAAWCMGNEENNGLPFGADFYRMAKSLDPTRLVIDSDGIPPATDRPTLDYRAVQFAEHQLPWGASHNKYVNSNMTKPTIVHEMGNISCLPDPSEASQFDGTIKPFWLEAMAAAVKRQHLENELPKMLAASWHLQASLLKLNMEAARLGPGICGYDQWLFRDYWTQSTGIESIVGTTRALSAEYSRMFNGDAVLLWDHDQVNFHCGQSIPLHVVLSDFRPATCGNITRITARLGDSLESLDLRPPPNAHPRGNIGPWTGELHAPILSSPTKLLLSADPGEIHNQWPVWIWPDAPDPDGSITISDRLMPEVLQKLRSGATVLLLAESNFPSQIASFKPAWWRGDEHGDFCYGNFFTDHPALAGFPHEGCGDLQTYTLLNNRLVTNLDEMPGDLQPIVWAIDVPWKLRRMAYLWEARVGSGKLIVSNFDLTPTARRSDPAAAWMYSLLTRYAAGSSCQPQGVLSAQWLADHIVNAAKPVDHR